MNIKYLLWFNYVVHASAASRILGRGGGGKAPRHCVLRFGARQTRGVRGHAPPENFGYLGLRSLLAQFQLIEWVCQISACAAACQFDRASYYLDEIVDVWSRKCHSSITKVTTYQLLCAHPYCHLIKIKICQIPGGAKYPPRPHPQCSPACIVRWYGAK